MPGQAASFPRAGLSAVDDPSKSGDDELPVADRTPASRCSRYCEKVMNSITGIYPDGLENRSTSWAADAKQGTPAQRLDVPRSLEPL
jgi:hypothetical protein